MVTDRKLRAEDNRISTKQDEAEEKLLGIKTVKKGYAIGVALKTILSQRSMF